MSKLTNLFYLVFFIISVQIQAQQWQWANSFGNSNNDNSTSMSLDGSGNVFIAGGYFNTSLTIGSNLLSNSGGGDLYIAKYSPSGTVLWAQSINGTGAEFLGSISTGTNGNVYVCGTFDSPTLNVSGTTLTKNGTLSNYFIGCYSSAGAMLWAYNYGNTSSPYNVSAKSCAYSSFDNSLYVTGSFTGTLTVGANTLVNSTTNNDVFLAKYSIAAFSASPVWAIKTGGSTSGDIGISVKVDNAANIYVGGTFAPVTGSTSTIGGAVTSQGGQDNFIVKYNSSGTYQWVRTFGTNTGNEGLTEIALDGSSNVYACGFYNAANLVFPTGSFTLTNNGVNDGYFTKFNSSGTFQWANKIGGSSGSDYIYGISTDNSNNVYITGAYASSTTTIGTTTYTVPANSTNAFVAKYSTANTYLWSLSSSGTASVSGTSRTIANDNSGTVYTSGSFFSNSPISFNTSTLTSIGQNDVFLAKISCTTPTITASGASQFVCANTVNSLSPYINSPQSDVTYSWSVVGASGISISPVTGTATTISYTGTTSFSIVVTGTNACSNVTTTVGSVAVGANPTVTATSSQSVVCHESFVTFNASGASSYDWFPMFQGIQNGVPKQFYNWGTTPVTQTVSVRGWDGGHICNDSLITFTITVMPNPTITVTGSSLTCMGATNILTAQGGSTYTWSPGSVVSPTYAANASTPTVYSVSAHDAYGCFGDTTFTYSFVTPQTPDICEVTVDSLSQYNNIIWDKSAYTNVDSFIVYREVSTNIYKRIGAQDKNALSLFVDTARSIGPANGDPNVSYYKYKLQLRDTCGNYSALSLYHSSVYFITISAGTYIWNSYAVESSVTPVTYYELIRDNNATGTWTVVGNTTGTTLNDPAATSYTNAIYRVLANGFNCTPTAKVAQQIIKSKSNVKNNFNLIPTGIKTNVLDGVSIAPNPAKNQLFITFNASLLDATKISILDILGKVVYSSEVQEGNSSTLTVSELSNGIYFVKIEQGKNYIVKKFIKE